MRSTRLVPVPVLLALFVLSLGPSAVSAQDVFTPWNVARLKMASSATKSGDLVTLRQDGFTKVRAGVTTVEEVVQALST